MQNTRNVWKFVIWHQVTVECEARGMPWRTITGFRGSLWSSEFLETEKNLQEQRMENQEFINVTNQINEVEMVCAAHEKETNNKPDSIRLKKKTTTQPCCIIQAITGYSFRVHTFHDLSEARVSINPGCLSFQKQSGTNFYSWVMEHLQSDSNKQPSPQGTLTTLALRMKEDI